MAIDKDFSVRDKKITSEIHKLFWKGMLKDKFNLFLTLFYLPSYFLIHVFIPLQVAYTLQDIFAKQFDRIDQHIYVIALCGLLKIILNAIGAWAHNRNGIVACEYAQRKVFGNFLDKDYEFYTDQFVGSLGAQAATLRDMCSAYTELIINQVFKHSAIVVGGITVLAFNSPQLALITVLCMIMILSYTIITSNLRLKYRREVSEASSELAGVLGDALSHGSTVKSFATEDYEQERLGSGLSKWKKAQLKSWDLFIPANTGRDIFNILTLAILLSVTAYLYKSGDISVAIVILVQLYMIRLIATTVDISDTLKQYEQIMGTAHQAVKTMQIKKTIIDKAKTKKINKEIKSIKYDKVLFSYKKSKSRTNAVSGFDLTINKGEKVGLVGYSGSGKTTLTKLLLRFMDVSDGAISINGDDIRDMSQQDLRRHIAYVPQEPLLFHRSIYENIAYGRPDATKKEILSAANQAYLDEFVAELSDGYNTLVGERGIKLSGGQRQRVAIARAILKDAPVLVLDEATSALDSRSEYFIQQALFNLMKDRTSLVIAHRLSTIQRMDRIVVMDKGKVSEVGTHEVLKNGDGIYSKLWQHQSGGYLDTDLKD